ncbi:MAG: hypothetical protein GY761_02720 [Hyphomicrobiales bacterium]|nr:hypothetical protein [Hyphomicrobiales bacterium]
MTIYIYAGPTISSSQVCNWIDAVVLPPVEMGDIYRIVATQPAAIGIVDGFFDGVPSVWHKEILWAINQGLPVFGASSMGALRAAELHTFGMCGVGSIFEAFRDGILEDDDEVALHHGPAQTGYVCLSEPMVNIRATLQSALEKGIISQSTSDRLIVVTKNQYYPKRNWKNLMITGRKNGVDERQLDVLEQWLPENRVDQKLDDAIAMLKTMSEFSTDANARPDVGFNFEWTVMWNRVVRSGATEAKDNHDQNTDSWVVDELRLDPNNFKQVQRGALSRFVVEDTNIRKKPATDLKILQKAISDFRRQRGLFLKTQLDDWLIENDLDMAGLEQLIEEEIRLAEFTRNSANALRHHLLAELRMSGAYSQLAVRARCKKRYFEENGSTIPAVGKASFGAMQLRIHFFENHFKQSIPDDLENFLLDNGYDGVEEFDQMLAREFIFNNNFSKNN